MNKANPGRDQTTSLERRRLAEVDGDVRGHRRAARLQYVRVHM